MNFVTNHAPSAGLIARPVDHCITDTPFMNFDCGMGELVGKGVRFSHVDYRVWGSIPRNGHLYEPETSFSPYVISLHNSQIVRMSSEYE